MTGARIAAAGMVARGVAGAGMVARGGDVRVAGVGVACAYPLEEPAVPGGETGRQVRIPVRRQIQLAPPLKVAEHHVRLVLPHHLLRARVRVRVRVRVRGEGEGEGEGKG